MWSSLAFYTVVGAVVAVAMSLLAPTLVDLFHVPQHLQRSAESMFRTIGLVSLTALVAACLGNIQQGLERYRSYSVSGSLGAVIFLAAVVVVTTSGDGLDGLAWAAVIQQACMIILRTWALRDVVASGVRLMTLRDCRVVFSFSLRIQVTALSMLFNLQTDKIVVGLIVGGSTLGQLAIGSQIAEAGRLMGSAALSPIMNRMAVTSGREGPLALSRLFSRLQRLWAGTVVGATIIGVASLYPLIEAWLGGRHGLAAELGAFLVIGYGLNILTGPTIAYLRALGRPGLEARLGFVTMGLNLLLSVVLGLAFGAVGVVLATMIAFALATLWFFWRFEKEARIAVRFFESRTVTAAILAGLLSCLWGFVMFGLLGRLLSLVPVVLGTSTAFVLYAAFVARVRPTLRVSVPRVELEAWGSS